MTGPTRADAILFDLDGTLVDTAPDMVAALARLVHDEGREPLSYELARSHVSNGAIGLVRLAFPGVDEAELERLRLAYLEVYAEAVCVESVLFPGLGELLDVLDENGRTWGVVTNKPQRMTRPLLAGLGIESRAVCVISGDSLPQRKPHPAPLLLGSEQAGAAPERVVYIGDSSRDIEAGRAAGMGTIAAAYGYVTSDDDPWAWNADQVAADTEELTKMVLKAVNLHT